MKTSLRNVSSGLTFASFIIFTTQLTVTLLQLIISYGILLFIDPFTSSNPYLEQFLQSSLHHNYPIRSIIIILFLSLFTYFLYKTTKAIRNEKKATKWLIITLVTSTIMVTLGQNLALIAGIGVVVGLISMESQK